MLAAAALGFFVPINPWYILFGGLVATLIDIDHVLAFWRHHGHFRVSGTWNASTGHLEKLRTPYIHGWLGVLIFGAVTAVIYLLGYSALAAVIFVSFASHLLLDYVHIAAIDKELVMIGHYIYPITIGELITDVFIFDLLMITLLSTGVL